MNKSDLIASVAEKAGLTKKVASEAVEATLASIEEALSNGDKVTL
ncbi:MAG: HU family DNA-binding protein, partial [Limnochordia bacterium]